MSTRPHRSSKKSQKSTRQRRKTVRVVMRILNNKKEGIRNIRNIQMAAKHCLNFKDLESYNIYQLQVSIQEDNLDKLVKNNIKVCLGNPSEVMIRRTNITRASSGGTLARG